MNDTITILLASRHDEDRDFIIAALSEKTEFTIAGIEKDETGVIIRAERLQPDIVILDLHLNDENGLELVRIIRRRSPAAAIILVCGCSENNYTGHAFKAGISGFILKGSDMDKMALIVKLISTGGYYLSGSVIIKIINALINITDFQDQNMEDDTDVFSPIERGIIEKIAAGLTDDEIARHYNYSSRTIKNHLTILKRKTRQENRVQIAVFSIVYGFVSAEQLNIGNNRQFTDDIIQ